MSSVCHYSTKDDDDADDGSCVDDDDEHGVVAVLLRFLLRRYCFHCCTRQDENPPVARSSRDWETMAARHPPLDCPKYCHWVSTNVATRLPKEQRQVLSLVGFHDEQG